MSSKIIPIDKTKVKQKKIIASLCKELMERGIMVKREALSTGKGWTARSGKVTYQVTDQMAEYFYLDTKMPLAEQIRMLKELNEEL